MMRRAVCAVGVVLFLPVWAQDNKNETVFIDESNGFLIRKPADKKKAAEWEFDTKDLKGAAVLRIRHKVVMAMAITLHCYKAGTRGFELDKQADAVEDSIKKSGKENWQDCKKKEGKKKIKWFSGEQCVTWIYEFTSKNNDVFEDRVFLWVSSKNGNMYLCEVFTAKGEWEKYGKQINEMLMTLTTFRPKKK